MPTDVKDVEVDDLDGLMIMSIYCVGKCVSMFYDGREYHSSRIVAPNTITAC